MRVLKALIEREFNYLNCRLTLYEKLTSCWLSSSTLGIYTMWSDNLSHHTIIVYKMLLLLPKYYANRAADYSQLKCITKEKLNFLFLHLLFTNIDKFEHLLQKFRKKVSYFNNWKFLTWLRAHLSVSKEASTMDELCQRFPLMVEKILNRVNNETLINFKQAGRDNATFLENERFYWPIVTSPQ